MTNDDRSNDDRTGDGQAPRWGQAPQQPADDGGPRYGERVDPAAGSTPQYGSPQYGSPQYGSAEHGQQQDGEQTNGQQQYGSGSWNDQQQSHQPYAASSAPASAGAPAWQSYEEQPAKKKKRTVGVVAFVVGLLALVVGVVGGSLFGAAFGDSSALREAARGGSTTMSDSAMVELMSSPGAITASLLFYLGTGLGLWAIVQGIVAAVVKRGRAWGVWAIVLAVVALIGFVIAVIASIGAAAANSGLTP